jgi:hypothetical protein
VNGEDRALFTRVIVRRNFSGFPFWATCAPETCARLTERAVAHAATRGLGAGTLLANLAPGVLGILRERMQLPERPASLPGNRGFKRLFTGNNPADHALFGETEHWTRVRTHPGLLAAAESRPFLTLEDQEEREGGPVFCHTPEWGFLTSDPSHAGTGLQFEAGLHLPALTAARKVAQVQQALAAMGCELQPLSLRHPGSAEAGFFRLLARGGPGISPEDAHRRFTEKTGAVLAAETEAWTRWNGREPLALADRMHRALRLLQEARRMEFAELLLLASFARGGVYAGIFPASLLSRLEELRVKAQPFHIRAQAAEHIRAQAAEPGPQDGPPLPLEEEHARRATLARSLLSDS